ncbi:MAG: hypothetical protein ACRDJW_18190 [Thermomicrobiales bacterium]
MATARSPKETWQMLRLARLGRRCGTWALGFGLVGLHVALFLVAATALILLDLYRSPDQITVDDGLRAWGSIVALHALAVTVFQIVRWAIHEEHLDPVAPVLDRPISGPLPAAQTGVAAPSTAPANGQAHGAWWRDLRGSWRTLMDANDPAAVVTTTAPAPGANGHTPHGVHPWPSRDTVSITSGAWPERAHGAPPPDDDYIASNEGYHVGTTPAHWSWVEAAAASWLTPGDPEQPSPAVTPPPPPDDPDTPASNA